MSTRPKLLDLCCKAGGTSMGYHRAGFDVTGVDIEPQPRFPFRFIQADALEYVAEHGHEYDVIAASPPCQRYTRASFTAENRQRHPDLIGTTRSLLQRIGVPYVIENVNGAPMQRPAIELCGLMFSLKVFRHRYFESSIALMSKPHPSHRGKRIGIDGYCCVIGHGGGPNYRTRLRGAADNKVAWQRAMGIDWMTRDEMSQAIPPAYTEFIGRQLIDILENR